MPAAPPPLPVGLIGLGKHARRYLDHIRRDVPELCVAAVSRRDEALGTATAREVGATYHRDHRDLVADPSVRAVVAVLPPSEHAPIVEACIRAGKPLLVEKPFATTADEACRLRDRIEASALPCLVAQTVRLASVVRVVRELLPRIGVVSQIVLGKTFEPSSLAWLDDPKAAGGGNVLHTGIHAFDLLRYLTGGEVREVTCQIARVRTLHTEDSFSATLSIECPGPAAPGEGARDSRVLATVYGSRATASRSGEIRIVGSDGQLVAEQIHGRVAILRGWEREELAEVKDEPTVLAVLKLFRAVAEGRVESPITARDGAAAVVLADACYRSARSGRRVTPCNL